MSDQGPVPERRDEQFGLIETLLWTQGEGYYLLAEHLARLVASSAALGFVCKSEDVATALTKAVTATKHPHLRVRLVLSRDGAIETRRFESVIPGVSGKPAPVAAALNRAANAVAADVAAWIG